MLTFQLPGTPTFVALDARGRVTHAMVGYPGREGMASWYRAAAGEQDRRSRRARRRSRASASRPLGRAGARGA
jgi:hypothetical protein